MTSDMVDMSTQTLTDSSYFEPLSVLNPAGLKVSSDEQLQVSAEAKAFLDIDSKKFEMHPITLGFRSKGVEAEYLSDVAKRRWPVLIFIFCFDIGSFCLRTTAKLISGEHPMKVFRDMLPQLCNMCMLYTFVTVLNRRSRQLGDTAAKQEECLLSAVMALAVSFLLTSLTAENAQDYVLVTYFLITTTTFLKLRWLVGALILALPVLVVWARCSRLVQSVLFGTFRGGLLPQDAMVHILIAWAVGSLMSFLAESYRRQMFANHKLAVTAAEKEILEMHARIQAQNELADAQAQAAARALCVAREKAANEAKSDFMSLMCHEVRTPLNGALASVEMLLETPLEDEQRDLAKTIRVSGSILLSTVSNFLDFFKIEAGKQLDIVRSEIDVEQLVGDVHCIIEAMIGRSDDLRLLRPDLQGVPQVVLGDPDRVCGILLNLYTNAAKFTKQGFIAVRVRVCGKDFQPDPTHLEQLYKLRDIQQTVEGNKAAEVLQEAAGAESMTQFQLELTRTSTSSLNGQDRLRHSSCREDGMRVWEKQYSAEDGSRVRRRLSAEQEEKERHGRTSKDSVRMEANSTEPRRSEGRNANSMDKRRSENRNANSMDKQRRSEGRNARSLEMHATEGREQQSVSKAGGSRAPSSDASTSTFMRTTASSSVVAATQTAATGTDPTTKPKKVAVEVQTLLPYEVALINRLQETDAVTQSTAPAHVRQLGNGWSSVVSNHDMKGIKPHTECDHWLMFEVIDTGHGICAEGLSTLFRQYEQGTDVDMRKPRRRGGTGLGLSICSKQVAVLGGQIGVMSKMDHGSTFWFTIPLIVPRTRPNAPVAVQHRAPKPREAPFTAHDVRDLYSALSTVAEAAEGRSSGSSMESFTNQGSGCLASPKVPPTRSTPAYDPWEVRQVRPGATQITQPFNPSQRASSSDVENSRKSARLSANRFMGQSTSSSVADCSAQRAQGPSSFGSIAEQSAAPSFDTAAHGDASSTPPVTTASRPWQFDSSAKSWTIPSRRSLDRRTSIDTTALQGRRVLLAEDNLINQTVAKKMLTSLGMQCSVASNGYEAIEALTVSRERGEDFDVVLMDMAMPRMGGVEATKIIRKNDFRLPIVAMTANASDKDRDECLEAGMDGFLSKPVLKDRLAEAMLAALSGHANFSDETMPSNVFDRFGH